MRPEMDTTSNLCGTTYDARKFAICVESLNHRSLAKTEAVQTKINIEALKSFVERIFDVPQVDEAKKSSTESSNHGRESYINRFNDLRVPIKEQLQAANLASLTQRNFFPNTFFVCLQYSPNRFPNAFKCDKLERGFVCLHLKCGIKGINNGFCYKRDLQAVREHSGWKADLARFS